MKQSEKANPQKPITYSICELMEKDFYVPHYKRGFTWFDNEVGTLLDEMYSFALKRNKKKSEYFDLGTLEVEAYTWERSCNGSNDLVHGWLLKEGQNRLCTIKIVMHYLFTECFSEISFKEVFGKEAFKIDFTADENMEAYLEEVGFEDENNADKYLYATVYHKIKHWFLEKSAAEKGIPNDCCISMLRMLAYDSRNQRSEGFVGVKWDITL